MKGYGQIDSTRRCLHAVYKKLRKKRKSGTSGIAEITEKAVTNGISWERTIWQSHIMRAGLTRDSYRTNSIY